MRWFRLISTALLILLTQRTGAQDPGANLAVMMAREQQRQICVLQDRIIRLEQKLYPNPASEVDRIRFCESTPR